jgi:hypothetical protein
LELCVWLQAAKKEEEAAKRNETAGEEGKAAKAVRYRPYGPPAWPPQQQTYWLQQSQLGQHMGLGAMGMAGSAMAAGSREARSRQW